MKVRYKKKQCEVLQEYDDVLIIKYEGKAAEVLRSEVKENTRHKRKECKKDADTMEK